MGTRVGHALEPLSADEVRAAVPVVKRERPLGPRTRFIQVALLEPPKGEVLNGGQPPRRAEIVLLDGEAGTAHHAVVSLTDERLEGWEEVTEGQPPITLEEFALCEQACRADPGVRAALAKRGVTDMDLVWVDPWSAGVYPDEAAIGRLVRALLWVRNDPDDDNAYAHPIENLAVMVDLTRMAVVRVDDHGVVPIPRQTGNYRLRDIAPLREDLKPLEIVQPEGPSFALDGHELRWQNWRLRLGFTPREGLVLHQVGWEQDGRVRPILYRASIAEMVVPYGDPNPTHYRKNAFDVGEYNIGALANSLELGCDCLGEIRYLDAVLADTRGEPYVLKNAICLHEEDYGILWKHTNWRAPAGQGTEVRRSRRLVISFIATVGNYEYGFFWYLYQDGRIEAEIKLTGIVSTGALRPGERSKYGQVLNTDGLYAPIHQHFFSYRLDLDIDGTENAVYEQHGEAEPVGPGNPYGAAFFTKSTRLEREEEATQAIDPLRGRVWKIVNPGVTNAVGEPVGYQLVPHGNVLPFAAPEASVSRRAGFIRHHLWVTPYAPEERFAAGDYPNQHPGEAGLPTYTAANRLIADTDVVLWYTLGTHHPVRLEDWPVMPVAYAGFHLQPSGFFDRNPALDVPPPSHNGHCHNGDVRREALGEPLAVG